MGKALLPFIAFDNFSRNSTAGWGQSTTGQRWSTRSNANFKTNASNGVAVIESITSDDQKPRLITWATEAERKSQSMLFSFNPVSWSNGASQDFGPVLLYNDDDNYVTLRIQPGAINTVSLWRRLPSDKSIVALTPDKNTTISPNTESLRSNYDFVKNQWYWCRIEYNDSARQIRYRIWAETETEPTVWRQVFSFKAEGDTRVPQRKGTPGFMCFSRTPFVTHIRSVFLYSGSGPDYSTDGWAPDVSSGGGDPTFRDTFDNRTERQGFGRQAALWYGSVIDNPNVKPPRGVGTVDSGSARIEFTQAYAKNGGYWAFAGNTRSQDSAAEVTMNFRTSELKDTVTLRVGPRGREGINDDQVSGVGLGIQIPLKANSVIRIARRTSLKASGWETPNGSEGDVVEKSVTLAANTVYSVKVQIKPNGDGYTLRGKLWNAAETEPAAFDLVFSSAVSPVRKGAAFINASSTGSGSFQILEFAATSALTAPSLTAPINSFEVFSGVSREQTTTSAKVEFTYNGSVTEQTVATIEYYPINNPDNKVVLSSAENSVVFQEASRSFLPSSSFITGLSPNTTYRFSGKLEQVGVPTSSFAFEVTTKYNGVWIEKYFTHSVTTNSFTAAVLLRSDLTVSNYSDTTASIEYREVSLTGSRPWSNPLNLIKVSVAGSDNYNGYGGPAFYVQLNGLTPDRTYEYRITVTDSDGGINGTEVTSEVVENLLVTTYGRKPEMVWVDPSTEIQQSTPIEIIPEVTTARIRIHYKWDIEDEVKFIIEYREFGSQGTAPYAVTYQEDPRKFIRFTSNPSSKFWEAKLIGLIPGMDYSVDVIVSHPLGTVDGTTRYRLFFTTRRQSPIQTKETKHYVYKVYDKNGAFLSTWVDAGEPSFGIHENGGVSDMTIKLPRQASEASSDTSLTLGNRVDLWVIDHTSDGIGRNMVTDADFNLGGWTTASTWAVYPNGGIDNGACLKVDSKGKDAITSYALSEYLQAASTNDVGKPYRIIISVSNLLDQYEEKLRASNVNYKNIQDEATRTLQNLFPASFLSQGQNKAILSPEIERITDQRYGLLRRARETNNYKLLDSVELSFSTDSLDEISDVIDEVERQGCRVVINEQTEADSVPYVMMIAAKALKGQITAQIEYVDVFDPATGIISTKVSEESVSTFGSNWQVLKLEFTPPRGTRLMRVRLSSQGDTIGYVDKAQVMPQELLIYRGRIETIKTSISGDNESISVEVMGLVAQLTDYYVQFKQWVDRQPAKDQPKLVDLSIPEDEAPPPTLVENTNLIKFRQSDTTENRHAILFPEITQTGVSLRVYYDGDDNENATCVVYYTPNMNSAMSSRVFTAVTLDQFIYSIEQVQLLTAAAGSTVISTYPENTEFQVLSSTLSTTKESVYKWVEVRNVKDGNTGYVPFESMTNLRGSKSGGVSQVVLARTTTPKFDLWEGGTSSSGGGGGGGAGGGGGGSTTPAPASGTLTLGRDLSKWSDSELYAWRSQVLAEQDKYSKLKRKLQNDIENYRKVLITPIVDSLRVEITSNLSIAETQLKNINPYLNKLAQELRNIQAQLDKNAQKRYANSNYAASYGLDNDVRGSSSKQTTKNPPSTSGQNYE